MNALIRETYEAPVMTNEMIEVHLAYLRDGLDKVAAELPALRDKIEKTNERLAAGDTALGGRIDQLSERVSKQSDKLGEVLGYQKALFWALSLLGLGASGVSIARDLNWI